MVEITKTLAEYDNKDKQKFFEIKTLIYEMLVCSLDNFGDHLGNIYQLLIPPAKQKAEGQFFTPYCLAILCAKMSLNIDKFKTKDVVTINDSCVGAGGMVIAVCEVLYTHGINYTAKALIVCNDIDLFCCEMAYVQLSFIGASAIIEHKNTLTQQKWDEFRTLGYLLMPNLKTLLKNSG